MPNCDHLLLFPLYIDLSKLEHSWVNHIGFEPFTVYIWVTRELAFYLIQKMKEHKGKAVLFNGDYPGQIYSPNTTLAIEDLGDPESPIISRSKTKILMILDSPCVIE